MPNYNHAAYLPQSVQAILAQSRPPDELVIVDDASKDNSREVLAELARSDARIKILLNEVNQGVNFSAGRALAACTGDYVYPASADDLVLPGLFEKSLALLERHPGAGLCSSLSRYIGENGEELRIPGCVIPSDEPIYLSPRAVRRFLRTASFWVQPNAALLHRVACLEMGGIRPETECYSDTFLCHALMLRYGACFLPEVLAAKRMVAGGYAAKTWQDPARIRRLIRVISDLMNGPYGALFPRDYVREWRNCLLFEADRAEFWQAQVNRSPDAGGPSFGPASLPHSGVAGAANGWGHEGLPDVLMARAWCGLTWLHSICHFVSCFCRHRPLLWVRDKSGKALNVRRARRLFRDLAL
jgi:glycosyltransferase involved in cell wall biosynthesis